IGTTDCESGQAVYYNKTEHGNDILKIIRASSSVPFIAPAVEYDNRKLLDGGIIDPIPVLKAQTDGYEKNVVIMTKPEGYEKQRNKFSGLAKILYRKYPKIAENLVDHYRFYNETISYMNQEEQKDNFFVIQPSVQLPISGIERNKEKLVNLYNLGYIDAQYHYENLLNWLEK
ncbi:patatin family protein, partial [Bacillus thuringiensis]|nr:patatin family protein [Bacillus thuringiensis]